MVSLSHQMWQEGVMKLKIMFRSVRCHMLVSQFAIQIIYIFEKPIQIWYIINRNWYDS